MTIPNTVISIESGIFYGCVSLASIVIEEGNPIYDSRENSNAIIETASNKLLFGCKGSIVPNSVTTIGSNAFNGCTGLTSINIPNDVTSIGESAFYGCSDLTSIIIPSSVTKIGTAAFAQCFHLTELYVYAGQVPETETSIFDNSSYNGTLHVPAGSVDAYSNAEQWKDFKNIVALTDADPKPTAIKR